MNNNNNHSNNGKEVFKEGQIPGGGQKESKPKPVNRIKKKTKSSNKIIHPEDSKKTPITINKNPSNINKNTPNKGKIIILGEKEGSIHPKGSEIKKSNRPITSSLGEDRPKSNDASTSRSTSSVSQISNIEKKDYKVSANVGKLLFVAAIILFLSWTVIFFYYNIGGNVHMLLALAAICGIISLVGSRRN